MFCTIIIINEEIIIIMVMKVHLYFGNVEAADMYECRQSLTTDHLQSISYV